jgi:hypothetical protein
VSARLSPYELWVQAGEDAGEYRRLLREHGLLLLPGDPGYDQGSATLPCGWPGPARPAAEWCIHDLPPGTCSFCTPRPAAEPVPDRKWWGPWIEARYPGRCSYGDERIHEGDRIRSDGEGGWLCSNCGDDNG